MNQISEVLGLSSTFNYVDNGLLYIFYTYQKYKITVMFCTSTHQIYKYTINKHSHLINNN